MKVAEIVKTEDIIKISANDKLSSSLAKLSSSHDAAFVFANKKFLGVINPYHCLIVNSFPGGTKNSRAMIVPPKIRLVDNVSRAASLMIESRIHYLPVFDDRKDFQGIITARRILKNIQKMKIFSLIKVGEFISNKGPLVTIDRDDSLAKALNKFKESKVSKLVVVDKRGKLRGILAYYDLIAYLSAPKKKKGQGDKEGDKLSSLRYRIRNFMKSRVLTVYGNEDLTKVIRMILDKKIGSVVLIDRANKPWGIITTKDILRLLSRKKRRVGFELLTHNLSAGNKKIVNLFVKPLLRKISKAGRVRKARLLVKQEKQGGLFKVLLDEVFRRGKLQVIKEEGKNLSRILRRVEKKSKIRTKKKK